jgi:TRAP-type C4-dicarboxylate transport system substrate-binding protein
VTRKILMILLAIALTLSVGIIGCTGPAQQEEEEEEEPEVIELLFATQIPPMSGLVQNWIAWGEKLDQLTDGRLKVTVYPAESLIPYDAQYGALLDGTIDISALHTHDITNWEFEEIIELPMSGMTMENRRDVVDTFHEEYPEAGAARNSEVKTLWTEMGTMAVLVTGGKEIRVPDDVEGMVFSGGVEPDSLVVYCGAEVEFLPPLDWYNGLERNVVDGLSMPYDVMLALNIFEVTKYILHMPSESRAFHVVMNKDSFNNLPADLQEIFVDSLEEAALADTESEYNDWQAGYNVALDDPNIQLVEPTSEELALWREKAMIVHLDKIEDLTEKGYPAQEAYDKFMEIIARYE